MWSLYILHFPFPTNWSLCSCLLYLLHFEYQNMHFTSRVRIFCPQWADWGLSCGVRIEVKLGFRLGSGFFVSMVRIRSLHEWLVDSLCTVEQKTDNTLWIKAYELWPVIGSSVGGVWGFKHRRGFSAGTSQLTRALVYWSCTNGFGYKSIMVINWDCMDVRSLCEGDSDQESHVNTEGFIKCLW